MAPVYADHPFSLVPTPLFLAEDSQATDVFDELASEMALVHNIIIRGLNSIYLQAPHIKPADEKSFGSYMVNWYNLVHSHHNGEETMFFPAIERLTGVEGLMDANIEQHKAFHDGLDRCKAYADAVVAGKEKYEGSRVIEIIDDFGPALVKHLSDEIPTILGLRQYADKLAELPKLFQEEADSAMKGISLLGLVWAFSNIDSQYENGRWQSWPPAPAPLKILIRSVLWWTNAEARKFGAIDRTGNMKHLSAVPQAA
ncbi:hypothetical protein C8A01DRAFT_41560 [Parachaetomium inaequale]|uniref:Hemerythrin-like domain-containing protein n=1 Tax=Parachaetomium inaequale TaxID=2588326 RepID=A0AAN6P7W4_9PEZI|nr:hypothetical protein C8A01DRAFT_41560 [Parachaetomium inaequale]